MKTTIINIVTEAINQARMEACSSLSERTMNLSDVLLEIEIILNTYTFDTLIAKDMFRGFITAELQKVAPSLYPAKMQMDQYGNYTSNQNLWA
jgi:hypothetical protein